MLTPISLTKFAEMRGVSKMAVSKAVKEGRLVESVSYTPGGQPRLNPSIAMKEWDANTNPAKVKGASGDDADPDGMNPAASFAVSRAKREAYQAELARLEVEEKVGLLVDADEVKHAAFKVARQVRDGMLNIADRIAPELAAETDAFKVHKILTAEIRKALEGALASE